MDSDSGGAPSKTMAPPVSIPFGEPFKKTPRVNSPRNIELAGINGGMAAAHVSVAAGGPRPGCAGNGREEGGRISGPDSEYGSGHLHPCIPRATAGAVLQDRARIPCTRGSQ